MDSLSLFQQYIYLMMVSFSMLSVASGKKLFLNHVNIQTQDEYPDSHEEFITLKRTVQGVLEKGECSTQGVTTWREKTRTFFYTKGFTQSLPLYPQKNGHNIFNIIFNI